jgi:hypothetical protein
VEIQQQYAAHSAQKRIFVKLVFALVLSIAISHHSAADDVSSARWITQDSIAGYSKQAYEKLISYAVDSDTNATAELVGSGSATLLKKGTKVFLVNYGFMGPTQIRLAGHTQELWIADDFLSKDSVQSAEESLSSTAENTDKPVKQQSLSGSLVSVKMALNQPLSTWQKLYLGKGQVCWPNDHAYNFPAGKFIESVVFDDQTNLATQVSILPKDDDGTITLADAKKICASLGLTNLQKADDGSGLYQWGKNSDSLSASLSPGFSLDIKCK